MIVRIEGDYDEKDWFGDVRIDGNLLTPAASQKLSNHSPDGFSWGYAGSGPAQLALAILLACSYDNQRALRYHQKFKAAFLQQLPRDSFSIDVDVIAWLNAQDHPNSQHVQIVNVARDISNAIALGMTVGATGDNDPPWWENSGWDQKVADVDRAAAALDLYQAAQPEDFWDEHDWYLTLDRVQRELYQDPSGPWSYDRVHGCVVVI